jgi:GTP cyclohydrolase I
MISLTEAETQEANGMAPKTYLSQVAESINHFVLPDEFIFQSPNRSQDAVRNILLDIGEDPERDGLLKTPDL